MDDLKRSFTKDFDLSNHAETEQIVAGANQWAVPWADLMMVMFVLFVVMFIYAESHQDVRVLFSAEAAQKADAASSLDPLMGLIGNISSLSSAASGSESVRMPVNEVIYKSQVNGISVIKESDGKVRVSLRGDLFFKENEDSLASGADAYLQEIADVMKVSTGSIHVVGYVDDVEAAGPASFSLSARRAADVASHLISTFGMDPKRFIISGRGAYRPELPGTSSSNRAMNRRVEVIILTDMI
ncbi:OmpA/MotB family protein [Salidesulfovibrio onnuriiensis]|uniref:OmpA/MotB family protein n=1 Tax=Salidesulfovibrio onnuriiensis TaxID=2583823 RepID=UPI0011C83ECF|nr:OmpA family protein [Salidesulfovibrio onnuriiensis]